MDILGKVYVNYNFTKITLQVKFTQNIQQLVATKLATCLLTPLSTNQIAPYNALICKKWRTPSTLS